MRTAGLAGDQSSSRESASPKDPTAAERQRRYRDRNRNGSDRDAVDCHVTNRDGALPLLLENTSGEAGAA